MEGNKSGARRVKCTLCNKRVKAGGVAEHMRAKHGAVASKQPANKPQRQKRRKAKPSAHHREVGKDYLAGLSMTAPGAMGKRVYELPLHPKHFKGTRLASMADLYNRWRLTHMKVSAISSASGLSSGAYAWGWTSDPSTHLQAGEEGLRQVSAYAVNRDVQISQSSILQIPTASSQTWYFTDLEAGFPEVETTHGVIHLVQSAPLGSLTTGSVVALRIHADWGVEFSDPKLRTDPTSIHAIYADSGYENYFTDSVSDWGSGKWLTLKHKQGGGVVPFSGAKTGLVYRFNGKSLQAITYTPSEAEVPVRGFVSVRYGVIIRGYAVKGMACFNDYAKAQGYANGLDSQPMKYWEAGPKVLPDNPAWVEYDEMISARGAAQETVLNRISGDVIRADVGTDKLCETLKTALDWRVSAPLPVLVTDPVIEPNQGSAAFWERMRSLIREVVREDTAGHSTVSGSKERISELSEFEEVESQDTTLTPGDQREVSDDAGEASTVLGSDNTTHSSVSDREN
nr:MAG: capsid protein [Solemoviridae sp.]